MSPPAGDVHLLQHTLGDLHMLHGNNLSQFLQTLDVTDLIHKFHTGEKLKCIKNTFYKLLSDIRCLMFFFLPDKGP